MIKISIIFSFIFFINMNVFSLREAFFNRDYELHYKKIFYDLTSDQFSLEKFSEFHRSIQVRMNEIEENYPIGNHLLKGYQTLLEYLDKMRFSLEEKDRIILSKSIFDLDYALKSYALKIPLFEMIDTVYQTFYFISVEENREEATNLTMPSSAVKDYYTEEELDHLKVQGFDLSWLSPKHSRNEYVDLTFNIEEVNVAEKYLTGDTPVYRDFLISYPEDNRYDYESIVYKKKNPLILVSNKNYLYHVTLFNNLHSKPTAGSLSTALGFYVEHTKYVEDLKVYFKDDLEYEQMRNDWNHYKPDDLLDPEVFKLRRDQRGKFLLIPKSCVKFYEFKDQKFSRIGPWSYMHHGSQELREVRGMYLFNMWIGNSDFSQKQNRIILQKDDTGSQLFYTRDDIGFSFGFFTSEKINAFPWQVTWTMNSEKVYFKYINHNFTDNVDFITHADARWMIRRIAKLSRKQIDDAVTLGGWARSPIDLHATLVEKLISRRNDLVKTFRLEDEIPMIPLDFQFEFFDFIGDGSFDQLEDELKQFVQKSKRYARNYLQDLLVSAITAFEKIDALEFIVGTEYPVLSEVHLKSYRTLVENVESTSEEDRLIVRDEFTVGLRLGGGVLLSGDMGKFKKYTLIHSVKNKEKSYNLKKFIIPFGIPYHTVMEKLPREHILIVESWIDIRGRLLLSSPSILVGSSLEISDSQVMLDRIFYMKNKDYRLKIYKDTLSLNQSLFKFFGDFGFIRYNIFKNEHRFGEVDRTIYEILLQDNSYQTKEQQEAAIFQEVIQKNNFEILDGIALKEQLDSRFMETFFQFSFFTIAGFKYQSRYDEIFTLNSSQPSILQGIVKDHRHWSFFSTGEEAERRFYLTVNPLNPGKNLMKLIFQKIDQQAHTEEFEKNYFPFIDGLSNQVNFLSFTPRLHSDFDRWGVLQFNVTLDINADGIEGILELKREEVMGRLSRMIKDLPKVYKRTTRRMGGRRKVVKVTEKFFYHGQYYKSIRTLSKMKGFVEKISIARDVMNIDSVKVILTNLFKITEPSHGFFNPIFLSTILSFLDSSNYSLKVSVKHPLEIEDFTAGSLFLYNAKGEMGYKVFDYNAFDLKDTIGLFKLL